MILRKNDCQRYIELISRTLTSDATLCLNWYGQLRRNNPGIEQSLHFGVKGPYFQDQDGPIRYNLATRELLEKRLLWSDYRVGEVEGGDAFGMHATELGWRVIEHMWPDLRRP